VIHDSSSRSRAPRVQCARRLLQATEPAKTQRLLPQLVEGGLWRSVDRLAPRHALTRDAAGPYAHFFRTLVPGLRARLLSSKKTNIPTKLALNNTNLVYKIC
jgi:hypothetical protein